MLSLFLTIVCSGSIALIFKYAHSKNDNILLLITGNYFAATIISFIFVFTNSGSTFSFPTFLFGILLAFLFVYTFFAFAKSVSVAGATLSTVSARLSVVIPISLSIIFFNEKPLLQHYAGFVLAGATIILFYYSLKKANIKNISWKDFFYLFILFAGIGLADFFLKVFQTTRPISDKPFFILTIFSFSFLYTVSLVLIKRIKFSPKTIFRGIFLGIPNKFSAYFLLGALSYFPAFIVYPVLNIGVILFTTIGAFFVWKEKINFYGALALLSGIIAIILLSLK